MRTFVALCFTCVVVLAAAGDFKQAALKCHNKHRKKHGSPPMKLNQTLNQKAQAWANNLANRGSMQHSRDRPNNDPGENLYWSSDAAIKPEDDAIAACDAWYDEIKDYRFSNPGFSGPTGHFTQLVWKASKQLGVGRATGRNGVFVVANYGPGGNINTRELFEKNVLRPK